MAKEQTGAAAAADPEILEREVTDMSALPALHKAEIDQQIATAKQWPRSITKFRREAMDLATLTPEIAAECFYMLPRANKSIEGPSVRLAEIVLSAWGNCRGGARTISEERDYIVGQGAFYDLERNIAITFETKRRIVDKYNKRYSPDMIAQTANAACAIALRNAVFRGVPKALWQDVYLKCREVARGDEKSLATRRVAAIEFWKKQGITEAQILKKLNAKGIEDIGLDELLLLIGIANAVKEGDCTAAEAFADPETEAVTAKGTEGLKTRLKSGKPAETTQASSQAPETAAPAEPQPAAPSGPSLTDKLANEAKSNAKPG